MQGEEGLEEGRLEEETSKKIGVKKSGVTVSGRGGGLEEDVAWKRARPGKRGVWVG